MVKEVKKEECLDKKEGCWMCDEEDVKFIDKKCVRKNRIIDESDKYYVIVPQDPLLYCHIMILLKGKHRENLTDAKINDLNALNKAVSKWTDILKKSVKDCRNVFLTCLCDSEKVHLHYHLFPVSNKEKIIRGHGHQWLGAHETIIDNKPLKKCKGKEKKKRIEYIHKMVHFLIKKRKKLYDY